MFKKEIEVSFVKECALSNARPFKCAVTEGISQPFRAEITLFSGKPLSRTDMEKCLLLKTRLSVRQRDTTGVLFRGRTFQGIITSYNALGLLSDFNDADPLMNCYGYEITVEPEMALMGLNIRSRSFDSAQTPAEIIKAIFDEYQIPCRFDTKLCDRFPAAGQIAQEHHETDLNFINRICFIYGFNYVFELKEDEGKEADNGDFPLAETVFSRGWRTGTRGPVTGNTLSGLAEIPCVLEKPDAGFASGKIALERLIETGFAGSGSIYKASGQNPADSIMPFFLKGFEARRGEGGKSRDSIAGFLRESGRALDRVFSERALIRAHDFAVASGQALRTETAGYLTVRTRFAFNIEFPKDLRKASGYPREEQELTLFAVAVPLPEDTALTLGSLCCFGRLPENPTPATAFALTEIPRPGHRSSLHEEEGEPARRNAFLAAEGECSAAMRRATVTDAAGAVTAPGTIVPADDDDTAFPALFYAKTDDGDTPVRVNYVNPSESAPPLGNFPKVGQRVLLLEAGESCCFLGYLPDREGLPEYDSAMRQDLLQSSFLNSGFIRDAVSGAAKMPDNTSRDINNQYLAFTRFSDSAALVKYIIMQKKLKSFMTSLTYRFNTYKIQEIYDSKKADAEVKLQTVIAARGALDKAVSTGNGIDTAKESLSKAYTDLSSLAGEIVAAIKDVKAVSDKIKDIIKKAPAVYTGSAAENEAQALGKILGLASAALFFEGTHREYGDLIERIAEGDIVDTADDSITFHAKKDVIITADRSVTIEVGNNRFTIDGNTLELAVAYFKSKLSPWDAKISLSPISGVSVSGFQFSAKALTAASIGDSFGGGLSSKAGYLTVSAPKLKFANLSGWGLLKTVTALGARALDALGDSICSAIGDDADTAADVISDFTGAGGTAFSLLNDAVTIYKTFKNSAEKTCSTTRAWVDLAISGIAMVMDVCDVLESLIANTILKNFFLDEDNVMYRRDKDNNYISGQDIYLMITSGIRTSTMIANSLLLMYDNLTTAKTASIELNSFGASVTGSDISIDYKTINQKGGPVNGKATHDKIDTEKEDVIENTDNVIDEIKIEDIDETEDIQTIDISSAGADAPIADAQLFVFMVSLATKALIRMIAENATQKAIGSAATTNLLLKNTEGDEDLKVSENEAKLNEQNTTGNKNDGQINNDSVNMINGDLKTANLDGEVDNTNTIVVNTTAGATKTTADVLKINTDGMDM
ncbi:contractile injection system protein, VgrG/Pvc8 family [Succinimonas sp.]|uniref:contractile injection system protein, VgrG/Pvc8 family n=1 Tax=Succinimonas sp. TaxID=1936151 RepID=UPI00386D5FD9